MLLETTWPWSGKFCLQNGTPMMLPGLSLYPRLADDRKCRLNYLILL